MPSALDLAGERYGRLVAVRKLDPKGKRTFWLFRCDCGEMKGIGLHGVRDGRVQSCGCLLAEILKSEDHRQHCITAARKPRTHGLSRTKVHAVWKTMHQRCSNPNAEDYRWYGALGVTVCERWGSFSAFYADMGEPNGLTLDRVDPRGNYEPSNCRWATWETQRANKRSAHAD